MTLFLVLAAVIILGGFLLLHSGNRKGANELSGLRHGIYGDFDVSLIDNHLDCALALDRERRKLALVRTQVPTYNDRGFVDGHIFATVVCSHDDIAAIQLISYSSTKSVVTAQFKFHTEVPKANLWKTLNHTGDANRLPALLRTELQDIQISSVEVKA